MTLNMLNSRSSAGRRTNFEHMPRQEDIVVFDIPYFYDCNILRGEHYLATRTRKNSSATYH